MVVEPLWVMEVLLDIKGVPLRPKMVVVPLVLVWVVDSPVITDIMTDVRIAVGEVEDTVIVDSYEM